jgi:hypothetical protein
MSSVSPQQWGWGYIGSNNVGEFMIHHEAYSAKQNILIQQKRAPLWHMRTATTKRIEICHKFLKINRSNIIKCHDTVNKSNFWIQI